MFLKVIEGPILSIDYNIDAFCVEHILKTNFTN